MQRRTCLTMLAAGLLPGGALAQVPSTADSASLHISRAGSRAASWAPDEYATGAMLINPLFPVTLPSRTSGASVHFEAGSRTLWHTHPLGQTLIVTAGVGWIQRWGDVVEEIRPGDVVWVPPDVKHWHGATPNTEMTHVALQDHLEGRSVSWMEAVSDLQYRR